MSSRALGASEDIRSRILCRASDGVRNDQRNEHECPTWLCRDSGRVQKRSDKHCSKGGHKRWNKTQFISLPLRPINKRLTRASLFQFQCIVLTYLLSVLYRLFHSPRVRRTSSRLISSEIPTYLQLILILYRIGVLYRISSTVTTPTNQHDPFKVPVSPVHNNWEGSFADILKNNRKEGCEYDEEMLYVRVMPSVVPYGTSKTFLRPPKIVECQATLGQYCTLPFSTTAPTEDAVP